MQKAYDLARKGKLSNPKVKSFQEHEQLYLAQLFRELHEGTYKPKPLKSFILRDPKTRKICASDFRDRIVHHALINVLNPIFEPCFIYDSYASRKGKGTFAALQRFDCFKRKVSCNGSLKQIARTNNDVKGYVLKCDIKKYFDTVDQAALLQIISRRVEDKKIMVLIKALLDNYQTAPGKGMPLGNWTSQFFANIYLNELDQFIKHELKEKYYIRYVDDFIILHKSKNHLSSLREKISCKIFELLLELHPQKCKILSLSNGVKFLGFQNFFFYRKIVRKNINKMRQRFKRKADQYCAKRILAEDLLESFNGWKGYAMQGNCCSLIEKEYCILKTVLMFSSATPT